MKEGKRKVEFYALSTCGWCRRTRQWLDEHEIEYIITYMDKVGGKEFERGKNRMLQFADRQAFPLLIIDDGETVVQGYHVDEFEEALL
jgi:glutaredoxin-like protein NrdH